jgi:catechol 2,3-dioxygenase-like lactoylglutathione lyase family enzyme
MSAQAQVVAGERITVRRLIHTIHCVADVEATRRLYMQALGGIAFAESYHVGEDRDMALMYVADHMIEPMAPRSVGGETTFARYLRKYGQGFHSIEFKVDDAVQAAAACKAKGVVLTTEYDVFFFIHPRSTGGVVVEVCDIPMGADPYDYKGWNPDWAEGHPSSLRRLSYVACATRDLPGAVRFFTEVLDGEVAGRDRVLTPEPAERVFIRVGDALFAFMQPDAEGQGPLTVFLAGPNSGVYALVWRVDDTDQAKGWFDRQGLATDGDGLDGALALSRDAMLGARHEFESVRR